MCVKMLERVTFSGSVSDRRAEARAAAERMHEKMIAAVSRTLARIPRDARHPRFADLAVDQIEVSVHVGASGSRFEIASSADTKLRICGEEVPWPHRSVHDVVKIVASLVAVGQPLPWLAL